LHMAGLREDGKCVPHGAALPVNDPRGHRAPSGCPGQTGRDPAENQEQYPMCIALLLFPRASPEQAGSCAPGERSGGFRVGCGCRRSAEQGLPGKHAPWSDREEGTTTQLGRAGLRIQSQDC